MDTSVRWGPPAPVRWGPPAPGTKDGQEEAASVHRRVRERGGRGLAERGKTLRAVADELGIHADQLRGWRNEHLAAGSAEALAREAEAAELARLRREVERLGRENEILERVAAFFAREAAVS